VDVEAGHFDLLEGGIAVLVAVEDGEGLQERRRGEGQTSASFVRKGRRKDRREQREEGKEREGKKETHLLSLLHVPEAPTDISEDQPIPVLRAERVINPPREVLRLVRALQRRRNHTRRRVGLQDTFTGDLGRDGTDDGGGGLGDLLCAFQGLFDEEGRVGDLTLSLGTGETAVEGVGAADVA
jgi:hypothetical protein